MRMTTPTEVDMRGDDLENQGAMWSYVPMEQRIPPDHPLRAMRPLVDAVLRELSPRFAELYSRVGRPSIAPEKLLRALLLQVLYTVRDRKSTRLNSSHRCISYAVFCLKKKKKL